MLYILIWGIHLFIVISPPQPSSDGVTERDVSRCTGRYRERVSHLLDDKYIDAPYLYILARAHSKEIQETSATKAAGYMDWMRQILNGDRHMP